MNDKKLSEKEIDDSSSGKFMIYVFILFLLSILLTLWIGD